LTWCTSNADVRFRTDIEQEVNGLYSFSRKAKLDEVKVKAIMDKAKKEFYEQVA
jgi:hypothetical protein